MFLFVYQRRRPFQRIRSDLDLTMLKISINKDLRFHHLFEHKMFRVYQETEIWQANQHVKYKLPEQLSDWLEESNIEYYVEEYSLFVNLFVYNDDDVAKIYLVWKD